MKIKLFNLFCLACMVMFLASCKMAGEKPKEAAEAVAEANTLTQAETDEGWMLLFNGTDAEGWRGYGKESFPAGWQVVDGTLYCKASGRGEAGGVEGGDIIFDKKFGNFELSLEWKISEGGNSGVFYLAQELEGKPIYASAPEMQVLDNEKHIDGRDSIHCAGALYDLIGVPKDVVMPVGEWNVAKVLVYKGTVEHWLNGKKLFEYHLWTDKWNQMVAASKFPAFNPDWANVAQEGLIGLQDHGDDVWYRNIKLREL